MLRWVPAEPEPFARAKWEDMVHVEAFPCSHVSSDSPHIQENDKCTLSRVVFRNVAVHCRLLVTHRSSDPGPSYCTGGLCAAAAAARERKWKKQTIEHRNVFQLYFQLFWHLVFSLANHRMGRNQWQRNTSLWLGCSHFLQELAIFKHNMQKQCTSSSGFYRINKSFSFSCRMIVCQEAFGVSFSRSNLQSFYHENAFFSGHHEGHRWSWIHKHEFPGGRWSIRVV